MPTLSIVIPVYNEKNLLAESVTNVIAADVGPHINKEIILVDDGSTDGTSKVIKNIVEQIASLPKITVKTYSHEKNQGKGAAVRTGFSHAQGDIIVIHDADLEYDPRDWKRMLELFEKKVADVVYGSRFYGSPHRVLYFYHLMGNNVISFLVNLLCNTSLTDIEVCYKMFSKEVVQSLSLSAQDFGIEVELTIKIAKNKKWRIYETGVNYYGRTYAEGKKIHWKDGLKALWYIIKYRFWG